MSRAPFAKMLVWLAIAAAGAAPSSASPEHRSKPVVSAPALVATNFSFPRAGGAHAQFTREWWRVFGFLRTRDGRKLDVSATFFRSATHPYPARENASAWSVPEFYAAAFGIGEAAAFRFISRSRIERAALGLASAADDRLSVRVGSWSLSGSAETSASAGRFALRAARDGAGLALDLVPSRAPFPLGRGGVERIGDCADCDVYGYAYPRLRASGTVEIDGIAHAVTGSMWLDHEFGSPRKPAAQRGAVRVAVQFADGRDLLITASRDATGATHTLGAALVRSDGSIVYFGPNEARLTGGRFAVDANGTRFPPSFFSVEVPAAGLQVAAEPKPGDPEIAGPPGAPAYFEGAADVSRYNPPDGDYGRAFVEVTGYDTVGEP